MKLPRLSISTLMVVVLIVALDFGIGKALHGRSSLSRAVLELLLLGGYPMGNILAVAIAVLVKKRHEVGAGRSSLAGFVAGGLTAWSVCLACFFREGQAINNGIVSLGMSWGLRQGFGLSSFAVLLLLLPQLGLAAIGRRVGRWRAMR